MSELKKDYTDMEWVEREKFYHQVVGQLVIPDHNNTSEVSMFNKNLSEIKTQALFDIANIQAEHEFIYTKLKNLREEFTYRAKHPQDNSKVTDKEAPGIAIIHLQNTPLNNDNQTIFDIYDSINRRLHFIKRVVEILQDKQQALVTVNCLMKMEKEIGISYAPVRG